jgi:sortase A
LQKLKPDDLIILTTAGGAYRYRVQSTQIVSPSDVAVLRDTGRPILTLITCYPFQYVGSAPQRYVVQAWRADESTETSGE